MITVLVLAIKELKGKPHGMQDLPKAILGILTEIAVVLAAIGMYNFYSYTPSTWVEVDQNQNLYVNIDSCELFFFAKAERSGGDYFPIYREDGEVKKLGEKTKLVKNKEGIYTDLETGLSYRYTQERYHASFVPVKK